MGEKHHFTSYENENVILLWTFVTKLILTRVVILCYYFATVHHVNDLSQWSQIVAVDRYIKLNIGKKCFDIWIGITRITLPT